MQKKKEIFINRNKAYYKLNTKTPPSLSPRGGPEGTMALSSAFTTGGAVWSLAAAWSMKSCTATSSSGGNGLWVPLWPFSDGLWTLCMATTGYGFSCRGTRHGIRKKDKRGERWRTIRATTHVFEEMFGQFFDVVHGFVWIGLLLSYPLHLIGYELWKQDTFDYELYVF